MSKYASKLGVSGPVSKYASTLQGEYKHDEPTLELAASFATPTTCARTDLYSADLLGPRVA